MEYCQKCGNTTMEFNRVEMFSQDSRDNGEYYFVCDDCFDRVASYLETPDQASARQRA